MPRLDQTRLRESYPDEYPDAANELFALETRDGDRRFALDRIEEQTRGWKREYPQLELSSLPPLIRLARLSDLIDTFQNDVLAPFELTPSDYDVLTTLRAAGRPYALSPSQLRETLWRSSGGMTKILKRLEESRLVERRPDSEDGRKIRVTLTARGLSLQDRAFRAVLSASDQLLAELTDRQKTEIDHALKRLHDQMEGLEGGAIS